jgi:hypothetical protein
MNTRLIIISIGFCLFLFGCGKDAATKPPWDIPDSMAVKPEPPVELPVEPPVETPAEPDQTDPNATVLAGTKWKLQGILNAKTDSLKILDPADCARCYTMEFDTDSTAHGFCTVNLLNTFLSRNGAARIVVTTEALDTREDPTMFEDILPTIKLYLHEGNDLQFICENEISLLFKKVELAEAP